MKVSGTAYVLPPLREQLVTGAAHGC
ncbi:hypothetical protein U2A4042490116 [Corynebacterium striatum]|nr:hypothetical protein U2A4042490116 [Corynebacterium striatum]